MLDKAFEKNNTNSSLLFHRGVIRFALGLPLIKFN